MEAAADYIGAREATGRNDGPVVEMMLRRVNLGAGYSWCGAFCYTAMGDAAVTVPGSARTFAWAPSWFPAERITWMSRPAAPGRSWQRPCPGNILGIWFVAKKRIAHVGIVESYDGRWFNAIEGNTNSAGSREGDGVYRKKRPASQVHAVSNWTSC